MMLESSFASTPIDERLTDSFFPSFAENLSSSIEELEIDYENHNYETHMRLVEIDTLPLPPERSEIYPNIINQTAKEGHTTVSSMRLPKIKHNFHTVAAEIEEKATEEATYREDEARLIQEDEARLIRQAEIESILSNVEQYKKDLELNKEQGKRDLLAELSLDQLSVDWENNDEEFDYYDDREEFYDKEDE